VLGESFMTESEQEMDFAEIVEREIRVSAIFFVCYSYDYRLNLRQRFIIDSYYCSILAQMYVPSTRM